MKSATTTIETKGATARAELKTIHRADVDVSATLPWHCR